MRVYVIRNYSSFLQTMGTLNVYLLPRHLKCCLVLTVEDWLCPRINYRPEFKEGVRTGGAEGGEQR